MCKIFRYRFTCGHGFAVRHSKCGGTKHKYDREGFLTPACQSAARFQIKLSHDCSPCQQAAFEALWKTKISKAEQYLGELSDEKFPDVPEVAVLTKKLRENFDKERWDMSLLFPQTRKGRTVPQVDLGWFKEDVCSPIRHEVQSDEIPDPPEVVDYEAEWAKFSGEAEADQMNSNEDAGAETSQAARPPLLDQVQNTDALTSSSTEGSEESAARPKKVIDKFSDRVNGKEDNDQPTEPTSEPSGKQDKPHPEPISQDLPSTAILSRSSTSPATKARPSPQQIRYDEQRR